MNPALESFFKWFQVLAIVGGLLGAGAIFSHRVNHNFDKKYERDKAERAAQAAAAEEREQARIAETIIMQEQLVAVGYVAKETADAHLQKCGPNEKITTALKNYADCRARSEDQLRVNSAKFTQRAAQ
jgi:hypothetical protein